MTLATILPILQQQDIRSANSTWLRAILLIGVFIIGILGGITKGSGDGDDSEEGDD